MQGTIESIDKKRQTVSPITQTMTPEDHIFIENYLRGLLSDEEKRLFEKRLQNDADFRSEYALEKQLYDTLIKKDEFSVEKNDPELTPYKEALKQTHFQELKQTLIKVNSEVNTAPVKTRSLWYYVAAVAVAAFIVFQLFFDTDKSNQGLYYAYAKLNQLPSFTVRDSNDKLQLQLMEGEQAFDQGDYKNALSIFQNALTSQKNNQLIYIYLGLIQSELEQYEDAKETFAQLKATGSSYHNDIALWYTALIHMKQDSVAKALEGFKIFAAQENSSYHWEALELMEDLQENIN
jgi:tetratricopeptide (TPR) repeat protein